MIMQGQRLAGHKTPGNYRDCYRWQSKARLLHEKTHKGSFVYG